MQSDLPGLLVGLPGLLVARSTKTQTAYHRADRVERAYFGGPGHKKFNRLQKTNGPPARLKAAVYRAYRAAHPHPAHSGPGGPGGPGGAHTNIPLG